MSEFTQEERRALAMAFTLAKERLQPYSQTMRYICIALDDLATKDRVPVHISELAQRRVILARLESCLSLEGWIACKTGFDTYKYGREHGPSVIADMMYRHRQQWLDLLIAEFSE